MDCSVIDTNSPVSIHETWYDLHGTGDLSHLGMTYMVLEISPILYLLALESQNLVPIVLCRRVGI